MKKHNNQEEIINNLITRCEDAKMNSFEYFGTKYIEEPTFDSTKTFVIDNLENIGVSKNYLDVIKDRTERSVTDIDTIIAVLNDIKMIIHNNGAEKQTKTDKEKSLKKYAAFISHATADKTTCVSKIRKEIEKYSLKVFYDESSIGWGDDLVSVINKGLKDCEFAIVILSKNFIKRAWPEKELKVL